MKTVLVYVESGEGKAKNVGLEILSAGKVAADGGQVIALVMGETVGEAAQTAIEFGADKVVKVEGAAYKVYNTDVYANALVEVANKYGVNAVFVGATPDGKDLAPKAAAKMGMACVANVSAIALDGDKIVYTSPVYAGAILSDTVSEDNVQFALLRSGAFKKEEPQTGKAGDIVAEEIVCAADQIKTNIADRKSVV